MFSKIPTTLEKSLGPTESELLFRVKALTFAILSGVWI
jgi:hypothetical protein